MSTTMTASTERPPAAACNGIFIPLQAAAGGLSVDVMPSSTQMMLMCDGVGWGPGSFVAPEAAPVLPSAVSSDVQWIMNNMLCLQHMGPEEAAKILKDIAALQGPYED